MTGWNSERKRDERFWTHDNVLYHARKAGPKATREELKALIDQLPEPRLEAVRKMLEHHVHPPPPRPEIEQMQRRSQEYKERVEQRFRQTRRPGTIGRRSTV